MDYNHFFNSVLQASRHYFMKSRRRFYHRYATLARISIDELINQGIQGIILDLDNTIVSEDDRFLSPGAEQWIQEARSKGLKFFILSNGKRRNRFLYWSERLNIKGINPAHKPSPWVFGKALRALEVKSGNAVVIGDSFHTDVMGGWSADCHIIQVSSLPHPPRWWEKLWGKWVQIPYPAREELWEMHEI